VRAIRNVRCPVFFLLGELDDVTPAGLALQGLARATHRSWAAFSIKAGATHVSLYTHPGVVLEMVGAAGAVWLPSRCLDVWLAVCPVYPRPAR
jgi:fermentation-respiration switch protein FrsA (DUF1100 family)